MLFILSNFNLFIHWCNLSANVENVLMSIKMDTRTWENIHYCWDLYIFYLFYSLLLEIELFDIYCHFVGFHFRAMSLFIVRYKRYHSAQIQGKNNILTSHGKT
uniref:Uncharacterized protein n=1 Tax=Anguilla anguilla TaxID=7936 RepID=A0A0E9XF97_ANGAN